MIKKLNIEYKFYGKTAFLSYGKVNLITLLFILNSYFHYSVVKINALFDNGKMYKINQDYLPILNRLIQSKSLTLENIINLEFIEL